MHPGFLIKMPRKALQLNGAGDVDVEVAEVVGVAGVEDVGVAGVDNAI